MTSDWQLWSTYLWRRVGLLVDVPREGKENLKKNKTYCVQYKIACIFVFTNFSWPPGKRYIVRILHLKKLRFTKGKFVWSSKMWEPRYLTSSVFFFPPELAQFLSQELFFSFFPTVLHGKTCLPTFFQTALESPHNGEAPIEGAGQNLLEQGKRVIVAVFCAWEQGKQKNRLRITAFMWEQIGQLSNEGRLVIFVTNFSIPILANQFSWGLRELKPFKNNGKKFPGLRRAFCLPPYCP